MATRSVEDTGTQIPVGTYRIDPSCSTILFTTRHLFGLGRVQGSFTVRTGQIQVAQQLEHSSVMAVLAADSVSTGNGRRDSDLRSAKFLDVAAHPDITFTSDRLTHAGGMWTVSGTLCAHGTRRPLDLVLVQSDQSGGELSLHAQTRIDRYEYGLTRARGMAARYLGLQLQVVARAENPTESW